MTSLSRSAIRKRARWIKRNLDEAKRFREHALPREYVSGETHFYLGRRYQLKLVQPHAGEQLVKLSRGKLEVSVVLPRRERVKSLLKIWYRHHAANYLTRRIGEITEQVPWLDRPPEFKLLVMRKQWGSCSPNGSMPRGLGPSSTISFSWNRKPIRAAIRPSWRPSLVPA